MKKKCNLLNITLSKLFSEKGYEGSCNYYYKKSGEIFNESDPSYLEYVKREGYYPIFNSSNIPEGSTLALTLYEAKDWLRESKNTHVSVYPVTVDDKKKKVVYRYSIQTARIVDNDLTKYNSYEEALEKGLLKSTLYV
jgi:hypothetical protein